MRMRIIIECDTLADRDTFNKYVLAHTVYPGMVYIATEIVPLTKSSVHELFRDPKHER